MMSRKQKAEKKKGGKYLNHVQLEVRRIFSVQGHEGPTPLSKDSNI